MVSSLNSALSGLRAYQQQLAVISNNITNATTENYTRKTASLTSAVVDGRGVGVNVEAVSRQVDAALQANWYSQITAVSNLDTKLSYIERIERSLGSPEENTSLSAELSQLHDLFVSLADSPEDTAIQNTLINQAETFAGEVNDYAELLNTLRNDAQDEIELAVTHINSLLEQVATLNQEVQSNSAAGKSTAALLDQRDGIVRELAGYIEINSFTRGDGVLVLQTTEGTQLADERALEVSFNPTQIGPEDFYTSDESGSINGVYVGGNPSINPGAVDITEEDLGGELGALIELRDEILPEQQAMLDELSFQIAYRFDAQGLRLFTDLEGGIPAITAPDPDTGTPVDYVGFSSEFQINQDILDNSSLIQQGTSDADDPVAAGSNEVIRRVIEFTFGDVQYQEIQGTTALRTTDTDGGTAVDNLQELLGLYSQNQITGTADLSDASFADITAIYDTGLITAPLDAFSLTISDPFDGNVALNIDLSAADAAFPSPPAGSAAEQIVDYINDQIDGTALDTDFHFARIGPSGQIVIESRGNVTISSESTPAGTGMGTTGLELLGLTEGTYEATDPYFEVQVGNDPAVRVYIEPTETESTLAAKLDAIPGLYVDFDISGGGDALLNLRPGGDSNSFGGDIKVIGGPFETEPLDNASPDVSDVTPETILQAIFGTEDPVTDVGYGFELSSSDSTEVSFRTLYMGPNASLSTGIVSSSNVIDFSQKMINRLVELENRISAQLSDEDSFRNLLEQEFLGESAVNIEEELALLIQVQTAFSASARIVSAVDEQFRELLSIF